MNRGRFDVWAPRPERVRLSVGDATVEMARGSDDWWTPVGTVPEGEVDYGYLIDDSDAPLPDPRSRRQPAGVHQRSRTFDAAAFSWTDAGWTGRQLAGSVIYELHIGTFTPEGTFDAALGKLDHLRSIGVDFVEVMPVNAVNGTHNWGYDGVLWSAVHEPYGGPAGYQRFVDGCHAAGLGVIQDVVHNHLGPSGNYLPMFGPYLKSGANTWGDLVNLDGEGSHEVRRYILDNGVRGTTLRLGLAGGARGIAADAARPTIARVTPWSAGILLHGRVVVGVAREAHAHVVLAQRIAQHRGHLDLALHQHGQDGV